MLPNHSAESKTNKSIVPIALHGLYLSRSQGHICTGVIPRLFDPSFTLADFQPPEQLTCRHPANGSN